MGDLDPLELSLKLEWANRQLEEKDALITGLRKSLEAILSENNDLTQKAATLKMVQDALLREKLTAEKTVEFLMREKAELASENARLHVFAKDCAAKADSAMKTSSELRAIAESRARAEELVLTATPSANDAAASFSSAADALILQAQLAASRIMLSRLLVLASRHNLPVSREQLLSPAMKDADPFGSGSNASNAPPLARMRQPAAAAINVRGANGLSPNADPVFEAELGATLAKHFGLHVSPAATASSSSSSQSNGTHVHVNGDRPAVLDSNAATAAANDLSISSGGSGVDAAIGMQQSPYPHGSAAGNNDSGDGSPRLDGAQPPKQPDFSSALEAYEAHVASSIGGGSGPPSPSDFPAGAIGQATRSGSEASGSVLSPLFRPFRSLFTVLVGRDNSSDAASEAGDADETAAANDDDERTGADDDGVAAVDDTDAGASYTDSAVAYEPEDADLNHGAVAAAIRATTMGAHAGDDRGSDLVEYEADVSAPLSHSSGAAGTGLLPSSQASNVASIYKDPRQFQFANGPSSNAVNDRVRPSILLPNGGGGSAPQSSAGSTGTPTRAYTKHVSFREPEVDGVRH